MRSYFTNEDLARLIIDEYNENNVDVTLIDEQTKEQTDTTMVDYLNVEFVTWYEHAKTSMDRIIENGGNVLESWKESLSYALGKNYALIEQTDEEAIMSQDINGATVYGKITFMCDVGKIVNLEAYLRSIKSALTGKPIKRETANGGEVVGYLTLGILMYDAEPEMTQVGEVIECSLNWKWTYMQLAGTYSDVKFEISLDGTNYHEMLITKYTWKNIFTKEAVPTAERVDLTGFIVKAISQSVTIAYFDFDSQLTKLLNGTFWGLGAYAIKGPEDLTPVVQTVQAVNIPVYTRLTIDGYEYYYRHILTDMEKVFVNNEFTISSIALNGRGKN